MSTSKKLSGIKAVKNGYEIKPQGIVSLWVWAQGEGHQDYFIDLFNSIKNKEFDSAKYVGKKVDDIDFENYDFDFSSIKGRIEINDTDKFSDELVEWLMEEGACEPVIYANRFVSLFSGMKEFKVPVEFVEKREATGKLRILAKSSKDAVKKVQTINIERFKQRFKQRCEDASGGLMYVGEVYDLSRLMNGSDLSEIRVQKNAKVEPIG